MAPDSRPIERRQLTVLFCDLVGSTALSAGLDPEDFGAIIAGYRRCITETVACFDGFVARHHGDGAVAYFGYPHAHEDDAERAVQASLAIVQAIAALPTKEKLNARVGVATGIALVGECRTARFPRSMASSATPRTLPPDCNRSHNPAPSLSRVAQRRSQDRNSNISISVKSRSRDSQTSRRLASRRQDSGHQPIARAPELRSTAADRSR